MSEKQEICPHCGDKLPWIVDAFCPSCGNRPDEPPLPLPASGADAKTGTPAGATSSGSLIGVLVLFAGIVGLFITVLNAVRGNVFEAAYTGVVAIAMLMGGSIWLGQKNRAGGDST